MRSLPLPRAATALWAMVLALTVLLIAPPHHALAADTLLSQGKPATASSSENAGSAAANAVDGNTGTRWSSAFTDPQWIQVDLGSSQSINRVELNWEAAFGRAYRIEASADGSNWTTLVNVSGRAGGNETHAVNGAGRYVRLTGTERATVYGYSLWELKVFGGCATTPPTSTPPTSPPTSTPPTTTPPPGAVTPWAAGVSYAVGAVVDYAAVRYRCRQAHTSVGGWEPPNVPALWQPI